jgi:hypothetical protein
MTKHPTFGFRTFKGKGSRLLRDLPDDDWVNVQAKEGLSGWKDGLLFTRTYAYQNATDGRKAQHLYRVEVTRLQGLDRIADGYGRTSDEAWRALYAVLKQKGVMPEDASELEAAA